MLKKISILFLSIFLLITAVNAKENTMILKLKQRMKSQKLKLKKNLFYQLQKMVMAKDLLIMILE